MQFTMSSDIPVNDHRRRHESSPDIGGTKRRKGSQETVQVIDSEYLVEYPVIRQEDVDKFFPPGSLERYDDGRIPLRYQIFSNKEILKSVLTKPKKGVFRCNHCDDLFPNFGELLDHFDKFDIKRPHKCQHQDCPWSIVGFNRERQLQRHVSSVHNPLKSFKCSVNHCDKSFGRMDLLNRHTRNVHENKLSRFNRKRESRNFSTPGTVKETNIDPHQQDALQYQQTPANPFTHHHLLRKQSLSINQLPQPLPQPNYTLRNPLQFSQIYLSDSSTELPPIQCTFPGTPQLESSSQQSQLTSPSNSEDSSSGNPNHSGAKFYKHSINFLTNEEKKS